MTEEVQTQTETVNPVPPADEQSRDPSADLNISDLSALKNIIDVATQRGAFKAAEMEAVGKVYNRLSTFLDSVSKKG